MTTAIAAAVTATPPTAESSTVPRVRPKPILCCLSFDGSGEHAYQVDMIEMAIRSNSVPLIVESIARGWLAPLCRAFDESLVVDYCEMRGGEAVAAYLRSLGWPERRVEHPGARGRCSRASA